ncbi:MAG: hypothetical protein HZA32_15655 [Opitutae bacterium]|nr:hypothetical protein [Opitutae bacterium]
MKTPASFLVGALIVSTAAFAAKPAPDAGPKTHLLFMGADFAVEWQGKLCPVLDVDGSTFIVDAGGQRVTVPSRTTALGIKISDTLKMTTRSASVTELKGERAYTRENDPRTKFNRSFANSAGASAATGAAGNTMVLTQISASVSPLNPLGPEQARNAGAAFQKTAFDEQSNFNSAGEHAARMGTELAEERFDAFDLSFVVSSPQPLRHPYLVVVTRYRENATDPKSGRIWVYAEKLEPVDAEPRRVRLTRGGFPPGYDLQDFQLHLYDGGQEIGTTVSAKRVPLTADEAFQYSIVEYVSQHRDATLPPVIARDFVPPGLRARLATATPRPLYVKVGRSGRATGVFQDEACTQQIETAAIAAVVGDLRFHPGLAKGKVSEGVATIDPATLPE